MIPFYYQPVTVFDAWRQTGPVRDLLTGYFEKGGGFLLASLIAVGAAALFSFVFYVMGRKFSLAKMSVWFIMLFLSGAVSFGLTAFSTGTWPNENPKIGLTATFNKQKEQIKDKDERDNYENTIKGIKTAKTKSVSKKKSNKPIKIKNPNYLKFGDNPVAQAISCLNFVYTLLLYWVFSLFFKSERLKITRFAFDIPHKWPQRR